MKKYFILISTVVFYFVACQSTSTPERIRLKFNSEGKFKIAQFTDMHIINHSPNTAKTFATIKYVLENEKPDVAILTGDIVIRRPSREVWPLLAQLFEEAQIPFTIVFGNHDVETITRDSVFDILSHSPYFIGEKGPENIHGVGNYVLPVYGSTSSKPSLLLYCLDSNAYTEYKQFGPYCDDWIHFDQILWYREQSKQFTQSNNNQPLPALAFFHIPLQEFNNIVGKETTVGTKGENNTPGKVNSGMFSSMVDMKDVMGVFVGHDHDNDFIGMEYGIALAYGRVTGVDTYGKMERGARIIELNESKPCQFTTWIRTPKGGIEHTYYYPSGVTKFAEETAIYQPSLPVNPTKQGVSYSYYEAKFKSVDEIATAKATKQGTQNNFSIKDAASADSFGYEFRTWINIPEKTLYYFYTRSDDGSKLLIDGNLIVNNDGSHGTKRAVGSVALESGFHELCLRYFEDFREKELEVGFSSKNILETVIPDNILFIPE
ncbi:3' 5'-cyclic adenosine monophosphate phosphodiesterase CpdA [termite gut metagenome]|uniref:3' 5'-cyclic adenosine monophosphate phosphodiesterase CpdA n=1 Tax=termite gut metagenome TaxID=433724 RepID=A0A5J4RR00_9ZZZZ